MLQRTIAIIALLLVSGKSAAQQPNAPQPSKSPAPGADDGTVEGGPASRPVEQDAAYRKLADRIDRQQTQLRGQQKKIDEQKAQLEALTEAMATDRAEQEDATTEDLSTAKTFSLYGFFDFNFRKTWLPEDTKLSAALDDEPMFVFGNLNTYLDWKPLSSWRMLAEVRFLLNPIGDVQSYEIPTLGMSYQRVNVATTDAGSFGERFDHGSIEIERAVIEWTRYPWLSVAAGLFLTPYGIWNIDHGSPTRTMASAPLIYALGFFPERQLGFKAFGSHPLSSLTLSYALTFSNGRGPANTLKDSDWDKAVGGRLELSALGAIPWKLGVSAYTGRFTDSKQVIDIQIAPADGSYDVDMNRETVVRYREAALAVDLSIDVEPLLIQAEFFANWRHFDDQHRPPAGYYMGVFFPVTTPGDNTLEPNTVAWGASGLLRYRLPLKSINLRPFFSCVWLNMTDNLIEDNLLHLVFGLNWRIKGAVVVKLEYHYSYTPNKVENPTLLVGANDSQLLVSQLAMAF